MKILKVIFSNLNSLRGDFVIDFTDEAFTQNGIFAITGPTGAGKSTILDAMCLALYSKTPRLNDVGGSNEIMSRSQGQCKAQVFFEAQGNYYLASFEQHRSRNKSDGALQAKTHKLLKATSKLEVGAEIESGKNVPNKVAEISGLDFDKFSKSMLLAQGNFASFLKSNENERSQLLEKLTGTDFYSKISAFIFYKTKAERETLNNMLQSLSQIKLLSDEELSQRQAQIKEIDNKTQAIEKDNLVLNDLYNQYLELEKYTKEKALLDEENLNLQNDLKDFEHSKLILDKASKSQDLKALYQNLKTAIKEDEKLQQSLLELQNKLSDKKSESQTLTLKINETKQQETELKQKQASFDLIFDKVVALDTILTEKNSQLLSKQEELTSTQANFKAQEQQLKAKEQELTTLKTKLQDLDNFLTENRQDEFLPELNSKLSTLQENLEKDLNDYQKEQQNLANLKTQIEDLDNQLLELNTQDKVKQKDKDASLTKLLKVKDELTSLLPSADFEHLQDEISKLQELIPNLNALNESLQKHEEIEKNLETLKDQEQETLQKQTKLSQEITTQKQDLEKQEQALSHQEEMVALKKQIASFEEQRRHLVQGKPCPLCGSLEHPFALPQNLQLSSDEEQALANLKVQVKNLQETLKQNELTLATTETELKNTQKELKKAEDKLKQLEETQDHLKAQLEVQLQALSFKQAFNLENLSSFITEANEFLKELKKTSKKYLKLQKYEEKAQKEVQNLEKELSDLEIKITKAKTSRASLVINEDSLINKVQEKEVSLKQSLENIKAHYQNAKLEFTLPSDYQECLELFEAKLKVLNERAATFKAKKADKDLKLEQKSPLESSCESIKATIKSLKQTLLQTQNAIDTLQNEYQKQKAERQGLFGDEDPKAYQDKLTQDLNLNAQKLVELNAQFNKLQQEIADLKGQQQSQENSRTEALAKTQDFKAQFKLKLADLGFENEEAFFEILKYTEDDLEKFKAQEQELLERQIELETKIKSNQDAKLNLQTQLEGKLSFAEVKQSLEDNRSLLKTQSEIKGSISAQLKLHEENLKQVQDKLALIEPKKAQVLRYEKLSNLIGSADGKGYRKFVQGISLEFLLAMANEQMAKLTDRYKLCPSDDEKHPLDIKVIDLYQFGIHRPTANLSGGETFLVSLALALGLSKMASQNVQVNSLFLDEGFGSLDDEALDSALDTLASLQQEGKLIGVISHIDKVKERIITQIEVKRLQGGFSTIIGAGCKSKL